MKRRLISIVLVLCMISLTLTPMTMVVNAAEGSEENQEMNALEALGIDTSQEPEGYDPNSRSNPYGKETVTLNPVGEFYSIGLREITASSDRMGPESGKSVTESVYESVYNRLQSTLYGHEKWGDDAKTAKLILENSDTRTIENADSEVNGYYKGSEIVTSEKAKLQSIEVDTTLDSGDKLALTAVAAGNFDGNTKGLKAQAAVVYAGDLDKNGGLYLKVGDINGDYGTSKTLLSTSADIGNPEAISDGGIIETFDSDPYLLQNYLQVSTGDYNGDGRDEIAVYIPELGKSRIQVYKLKETSGTNDYTQGDQWYEVWTYSLKETTYVSNMVSMVSGDFNSDGIDDIAATWGYYYGPEDNKGSTAVVLFGAMGKEMLQSSQEFSLLYGKSEIVRGAFTYGDLNKSGKEKLVLGGQLNGDLAAGELNSRFVAIYNWNGMEFEQTQATNFKLFEKNDDGDLIHTAMNRTNPGTFYSTPLCVTNLDVIGQGMGSNAKLYIDSLIIDYGEDGLTIASALDNKAQMQKLVGNPVSYVEYRAAAADLYGLGKESIATMQQTFSKVDTKDVSQTISTPRTYTVYERVSYYKNWFHKLFGHRSYRFELRTYTVTETTTLYDSMKIYTPGITYRIMLDVAEGYSDSDKVDASTSICVANTDEDTTFLNYNRKYFTYTDPEILAVLASPPYFKDLLGRDDLSGSYGESSTSYSKTEGDSSGVTATATISAGAYVSVEQEFSVFGVVVASAEAEIAVKANFTYDFEKTWALQQTVTYSANAGEDMVALYSIPLEIFEFKASVPDGNGGYETQILNVNIPHEASVKLMSLKKYEAIAADYDILPQIEGKILTHTVGDPSTYPSSTNGYNLIAEWEGTPSSVDFSSAGAAQSQEIEMGTETTHAFSGSVAIETKSGLGVGGVTVGRTFGIEAGAGYVMTSTKGSTFAGEIQNMPDEAEPFSYGHNWRIFCYEYNDGMSNFPIVNYIVTDVTAPPELPTDFAQDVSSTTDKSIVLTWSYDKYVAGFQIYRYYEFPDGSGSFELFFVDAATGKVGDDGRLHYQYVDKGNTDDPAGGLAPYTEYIYQIQTVRAAVPSMSIKSEAITARTRTTNGYPQIMLEGEGLLNGVLPIFPDSTSGLTAVIQNKDDYTDGFSYQWQVLMNGKWTDLTGQTGETLTFKSSGSADHAKYRCRINTIYYDSAQGNTYYISAYSDAISAEYSKRTAAVAKNSVTGEERFTATAVGSSLNMSLSLISGNKDHLIAPMGNVTFVINGTDYTGTAVGALEPDGTQTNLKAVSTAIAQVDKLNDGVYEVTAIYNGNRIFKSLTVSDAETVLVGDVTGYQLNLLEGASKVTKYTYGSTITPVLNEIKIVGNEVTTDPITNNVTYLLKDEGGNTVSTAMTSAFNTPDVGGYTLVAYVGTTEAAKRSFIVMKKPIVVEIQDKTVDFGQVVGDEPEVQLQSGSSMAFEETISSLGLTYIARNTANYVVPLNNTSSASKYSVTPVPGDNADVGNYEITYVPGTYTIVGKTYLVTCKAEAYQGTLAGSVELKNNGSMFSAAEWLLFEAKPYNGYEVDTWTATVPGLPAIDQPAPQKGGLTFSYKMLDEPVNVAVTFARKEVTLTTGVQAGLGEIRVPKYFVSGAVVTPGAELTFTAAPAPGYHFGYWKKIVGSSTTDLPGETKADGTNTYTLTMGSYSTRLYAVFIRDSYTLTLDGNLVATYKYDDDGLDTTEEIEKTVSSGAIIEGDTPVTVKVRTGYQAESTAVWRQDGVIVTANAGNQSYDIVMRKNTTISVPTIRGKYKITTGAENGSVAVTLDGVAAGAAALNEVPGGTKVTATATPNYGYEFDCWTENGNVSVQMDPIYILNELGSNLELTAHFKELAPYHGTVTLNNPLRGTIKYSIVDFMGRTKLQDVVLKSGGDIAAFKGDNITITVVPKENFMVGKWIVDGNVTDSRQKTFTLESISKDMDVQVDLEAQVSARVYYDNTISEATTDGDHFDSGAMVGCGTTLVFHTDPAAGKMVRAWKLNESVVVNKYGKPLVDNTYIIDGLAGTANVAVTFEDILTQHVIVDAANIEYTAKYEPEFAGEIRDGAAGIFTFRAKAGYRLDKSELEQKGIFDSIVYDDMTGAYNCRINGIYSGYSISLKAKELFTISCASAKNGKVTTVPVIAAEGDTVTIVTKANSGYKFGSVQATYMNAEGEIKDIITNDNTFVMPAAAVTVTSRFDINNSGSGGGGGGGGSAPKVTTPGTLGVSIPAIVAGNAATLSINDDTLAQVLAAGAQSGTVLLDVSGLNTIINTAILPKDALLKISDAMMEAGSGLTQLSVAMSNSVITFDSKALETIVKKNGNGDVALSVEELDKGKLSESERSLVGDNLVLDMNLLVGNKQVSDFGGGTVTASLPYELKKGETADGMVVWFMSDKGELTKCACSYKDGQLTFSTTHFSKFIAGYFPFKDLKDSAWYYESAVYAYENDLFKGTGGTNFSPDGDMTRAMLVMVLYRFDGTAESFTNSFSDVASGDWYKEAVAWAAAKGVVSGLDNDSFGPDANITREQLAAILYRYGKAKNYNVSALGSLDSFKDGRLTSSYAAEAMQWAFGAGLISGKGDGILDPKGKATRAEVAAILMRFIQKTAK